MTPLRASIKIWHFAGWRTDGIMNPDDAAILALDLGSTGLKGAWVGVRGAMGEILRAPSPLARPGLDAEAIWLAVRALMQDLLQAPEAPARPLAVALTGVTRTHVFVDAAGRPLAPVMPWGDPYGEDRAGELAQAYGVEGDTAGYGAFHPLARLLQFRLDRGAAPAAIVELRDWLNFRLTGRLATDAVALGRLAGAAQGPGPAEVLARLGLPASVLPPAVQPAEILGQLRAEDAGLPASLDGVPVACCSFDTWCTTLGLGAVAAGRIYDVSGTTEVLGTFAARPRAVDGMVCLPWTPGLWHLGGPCQTGLGTLAWFARAFLDSDDPAATLQAAMASTCDDAPLCLPYVTGERMPLWNSRLAASFHEVKATHTRRDLARAVAEGLALAHRLALQRLGVLGGGQPLHMGGGGATLAHWPQLRADAFGMPVRLGVCPEPALAGAALAAATALGVYPDIQAAQDAINEGSTVLHPEPARAAYFSGRARQFADVLQDTLNRTLT